MNKIAITDSKPRVSINKSLLSEEWALKIHGQTLDNLAERGGLSSEDVVINIDRLSIDHASSIDKFYAMNIVDKLARQSRV